MAAFRRVAKLTHATYGTNSIPARRHNRKTRTWTVYNWLQYFSPDALRKEFEVNGFKMEEFYSDVAGKPFNSKSTEFAIVARKLDK